MLCTLKNVIDVFSEKNTFALAHRIWLDDVGDSLGLRSFLGIDGVLSGVSPEIESLDGQNPRTWEEVEFIREHFLKSAKVSSQVMFFGDALNARIHVDLLVEIELRKELRLNRCIVPSEVILRVEFQSSLSFLVDRANIVL